MRVTFWLIWLLMVFGSALSATAQRIHPDDPMLEDDDSVIDVTMEPAGIELSDLFDRFASRPIAG